MPGTQQPHRLHRRLLVLAGTTIGIGLGLVLADSDPAHADDTTPTVTTLIGAAPDRSTDRPRPLHEVTDRLADTTKQTKTLTDHVDKAVEPLPVLGRTVDHVTDTTDKVIDTTATTIRIRTPIRDLAPKLPRPPTADDPTPAPTSERRTAGSRPASQSHTTPIEVGTPDHPTPHPPTPATDTTLAGLFEHVPTVTAGTRAALPPAPHRHGPAMVAAPPTPRDWSPDRHRHGITQQATHQNIDATSPDTRLPIKAAADLLCDTNRTHAGRTGSPSPPSG